MQFINHICGYNLMDLMKIATEALMEQLGGAGQGLDTQTVSNALGGLLGGAGGELNLADLIEKFSGGGLASLAQSWLGDGANQALSVDSLTSVLGDDKLASFAGQLGLGKAEAGEGLAAMIPALIDKSSSGGNLLESVGGLGGALGMASSLFK
jgi:uncharacterized protein YidB (DUF937 family)